MGAELAGILPLPIGEARTSAMAVPIRGTAARETHALALRLGYGSNFHKRNSLAFRREAAPRRVRELQITFRGKIRLRW